MGVELADPVRMRACLAILAALAPGDRAGADLRLRFRASELRTLTRELQGAGFDCPRIEAVFFVGERDNRNHMRVVCANVAAADLSQIRIIARGSGTFRAEPWDEEEPQTTGSLASALPLRPTFD